MRERVDRWFCERRGASKNQFQLLMRDGPGLPGVEIMPAEIPVAAVTPDGGWTIGCVFNGTQREISLCATPAAPVQAGRPPRRRKLVAAADEVSGAAGFDDALYRPTHKGAPRSQVLRLPLKSPDIARAELVVPQGEQVVTGIAAAADALDVERRDGNIKRLYKRAHAEAAALQEITLPVAGSFRLNDGETLASAADPRLPGLVLELPSWNRARQVWIVAADGTVRNSGLQPQGPYDVPEDIVSAAVQVTSHGGALAPASPRGSSVYGQDRYKAGWQTTRPNTWKELIACAEWLIAQKWTTPQRLGLLGGSAGGILVGRAMTERPDLFAAVVPAVGALDMVRAEVRHGSKTAARPAAASTSGKPILLRLDHDAGHGIGNTRRRQVQERTDVYAFLLWQLAMDGFQPKAP